MSAYGTTVASVNKANCLSPWGDLSSVLLPNVRVRDVLISAVTATTGLPFSNVVTDTIYESAVEGVMEVEIARAQDMIQGMRRPKVSTLDIHRVPILAIASAPLSEPRGGLHQRVSSGFDEKLTLVCRKQLLAACWMFRQPRTATSSPPQ